MKIFIGTSGWYYDWNKEKTLDWYIKNTGNVIELNTSFYRFPFPNQVKSWNKKNKNLRWIIKVHRHITHLYKLNNNAVKKFSNFLKIFEPLLDKIDYFLFQLPPSFKPENEKNIKKFYKKNCQKNKR